jgi:hypothetical protein
VTGGVGDSCDRRGWLFKDRPRPYWQIHSYVETSWLGSCRELYFPEQASSEMKDSGNDFDKHGRGTSDGAFQCHCLVMSFLD